jgi:hypothetical protein
MIMRRRSAAPSVLVAVLAGCAAAVGCADLVGVDTSDRELAGPGATGSGGSGDGGAGAGASSAASGGMTTCGDDACLEVPTGWEGPVALYTGPGTAVPPACPAAIPQQMHEGYADLTVDPHTCNACECDSAGVVCGDVTVEGQKYECPLCPGPSGSFMCTGPCTSMTFTHGECKDWPYCGNANGRAAMIKPPDTVPVKSGACAPIGGEAQLPAPTWAVTTRACRVAGTATCPSGDGCRPPDVEGWATCITQPGDAECPAAFPSKQLVHDGLDDTRGCNPCNCATGTCTTAFAGYEDQACTTTTTGFYWSSGQTCASTHFLTARAKYTPYASCTAAGGEAIGQAVTAGPRTFCCED